MQKQLEERTFHYGMKVCLLCRKLPVTIETRILIDQLVRSAASTVANYRAAGLAKSKKDFLYKFKVVEEE
jgi:four helix bundle protein